ncbi:hypothetical protein BM127P2_00040 [Phocaeicola phage BM127P2]|nr:hypothetical protein BM127P1_00025 [Phocaeicola phage BM127P1]WAX08319.1 hypothetical protein BM127P2_00040 [Phocaeicola phage BM127P2]WAX08328.1 hypothetical protein BM127P3_00002 [Phocaeicola phage BM127P3]WAX08413.1 hypothetical protein BM127P4_00040 [Phocaeicola phage BM127P4]
MITEDYISEVIRHALVLAHDNQIFVQVSPHVKLLTMQAHVGGWKRGKTATEKLEVYYGDKGKFNYGSDEDTKRRVEAFLSKYAK